MPNQQNRWVFDQGVAATLQEGSYGITVQQSDAASISALLGMP